MDKKRIFGSGPACFILGIILILIVYYLELVFQVPRIQISDYFSSLIFVITIVLALVIMLWGFVSLPLKKRGNKLVTDKAFKYFRHPIYAGFLDFFVFGLGFYLKSFGILILGIILIFLCGKIVDNEEEYLIKQFGQKYKAYQKRTKKFMPGVY
jgi:protein-S-isoprenylcysteine O-methyltransferase Ste14